jgi:rare lipoprotein A
MGTMGRRARRLSGSRLARFGAGAALCVLLANCAAGHNQFSARHSKYSQKVVADGEPVPKGGGSYKVGQPYTLNGRTYYPSEGSYRGEGIASWYGSDFHGRLTANGEVYDMDAISAAHPTMPLPSYARVTNLENGKSIVVRVNDRGPYARNRIIDLSIGTARALDFYGRGLARVRVEYVGRAPMEGSDDRLLMATLRSGSPAPVPSRVMVASAKPFLPPAASPRESVAATPAEELRGTLPPGRPFSAGAVSASARNQVPEVYATGHPQTRSAVRLPEAEEPSFSPTAGVPAVGSVPAGNGRFERPNDRSLGLMSGRGLY